MECQLRFLTKRQYFIYRSIVRLLEGQKGGKRYTYHDRFSTGQWLMKYGCGLGIIELKKPRVSTFHANLGIIFLSHNIRSEASVMNIDAAEVPLIPLPCLPPLSL